MLRDDGKHLTPDYDERKRTLWTRCSTINDKRWLRDENRENELPGPRVRSGGSTSPYTTSYHRRISKTIYTIDMAVVEQPSIGLLLSP